MTRIVILDTETTGKDVAKDQIIELCIQVGLVADVKQYGWRFKPTIPIHPEATAAHGITDADLADRGPFSAGVPDIVDLLASADVIVGYNLAFDLDILQAELERANLPRLDLTGKSLVDPLRLWSTMEPRSLAAAHERFVGQPMVNAHAASADVFATGRVLTGMLSRFGLAEKPWPELAAMANPFDRRTNWIGPSQHFQWDGENVVIGFGKHRGNLIEVADFSYFEWMLKQDFPPHVKEICREYIACNQNNDQFRAWLRERYPRPAQQEAA